MIEQQQCEANDFGMSDCENLATTTTSIDGDEVPACADCAEVIRDFLWENSAARRLGYRRA
jgi:hypothetical protein